MYGNYINHEYLISPINGYKSRNLVSNKGTIKKFGFNDIVELHNKFPGFPLECRATADLKNKISKSKRKKRYLEDTDTPPALSCFKDSKYKNLYNGIISKAIVANHGKEGYFEVHHVIPKSFGGSDHWSNLVRLTAREHFLCHYLLTKIVDRNSQDYYIMCHAFNMMGAGLESENSERYMNSRLFECARIGFSKRISELQSGSGNSQHGTLWICNFSIKENKKIKPEELQDYLNNGWAKRRVYDFSKFDQYGNKIVKRPRRKNINSNNRDLKKYRDKLGLQTPDSIQKIKIFNSMNPSLEKLGFNFESQDLELEFNLFVCELKNKMGKFSSLGEMCNHFNLTIEQMKYVFCSLAIKRKFRSITKNTKIGANIKIVKYREDNKLSPPSDHILSMKYIRDMLDTLSLVGFNFDAVCLDAEYLRIQKMLMDDIWVQNMSFVQVSQKYNANYMTLQYVATAFGVKRRTL